LLTEPSSPDIGQPGLLGRVASSRATPPLSNLTGPTARTETPFCDEDNHRYLRDWQNYQQTANGGYYPEYQQATYGQEQQHPQQPQQAYDYYYYYDYDYGYSVGQSSDQYPIPDVRTSAQQQNYYYPAEYPQDYYQTHQGYYQVPQNYNFPAYDPTTRQPDVQGYSAQGQSQIYAQHHHGPSH